MSLYKSVQNACKHRVWMQGRQLAESGLVSFVKKEGDELQFLVSVKITQPYEVYLWPEEEDWDCDCD